MPELASPTPRRSKWIISPAADLALLVATPLAIVPLVALVGRQVSAEVIFLYVAAFASIGHHLPGFLRAYGDRQLFQRFRWRFLLAPPVALGIALLFSWSQLHGLELLLLGWATWHIMMQTYGFMRIYDAKAGSADATSAWLDFSLCVVIFAAGVIFSPARVFGIVEALALVGVPLPSASWLGYLRIAVGIATAVVLVLSIVNAVRQNAGGRFNPLKWLLVLSTAWLYWFCGTLTTNLLVGVAMFEIFHALQYYAIVWSFNHRRAQIARDELGPLAALFGDAWWCLACYIAAIAAFGSLRLLTDGVTSAAWQQTLLAMLAASTILHFYFDGFIWKVRETSTQVNLGIAPRSNFTLNQFDFTHVGRWALLLLGVGLLFIAERRGAAIAPPRDAQWLTQLASWTPELPELQVRLSTAALVRGDVPEAIAQADKALATQPQSQSAHAALGSALLQRGEYETAAKHLRQAQSLGLPQWEIELDLGQALARSGALDEAETAFAQADKLHPRSSQIQLAWANAIAHAAGNERALPKYRAAYTLDRRSTAARSALVRALSAAKLHDEAIATASQAAAASKNSAEAQLDLGNAYLAAEKYDEAKHAFTRAVALAPNSPESHYCLGTIEMQLGDLARAQSELQTALRLQKDHGLACFQLANVYYLSGRLRRAAAAYRECNELLPEFPDAFNNRGAVLLEMGDLSDAAEAFTSAIRLQPERADSHYNLALVLLQQGDRDAARQHVQRASELGFVPSNEVARDVGL